MTQSADFNHLKIMLDNNQGISLVAQLQKDLKKLVNIGEMKAGSGFVQNVDRSSGRFLRQFRRELHALCLTPGELCAGLSKGEITEANGHQGFKLVKNRRHIPEKPGRFVHRHFQDVRDILAAVRDLQSLAIVSRASADFALDIDVRQKMHFDFDDAVSLAILASASLQIEAESSAVIAAHARSRQLAEKFADRSKRTGISGRI